MEEDKKYSKMMTKYWEKKKQYPDAFLFYRLGDFYEMFFEDAEKASELLGITLTARDCGNKQKAPMCGVPFHSAENYITKLTQAGYKVAICEQLSEPVPGQIVERDVVRIVTPGTIIDDTQLEQRKNNFIACVSAERDTTVGLAWIDITTGEFNIQQFTGDNAFSKLSDVLVSVAPSEILADGFSFIESSKLSCVRMGVVPVFYKHKDSAFEFGYAKSMVLKQLNATDLNKLNCTNKGQAICAAGALLDYLQATQMRDLTHINKLNIVTDGHYMHLDINTRLNLEICQTMYDRKKRGSLLWVLDKTKTTMGGRLLHNWLEQPLQDEQAILERLDAVEELTDNTIARAELADLFKNFQDIERLCGRVSYGNLHPKNCVSLGVALSRLPQIKAVVSRFKSKLLKECANKLVLLDDLANKLQNAFVDEPPTLLRDGGFIKKGFDAELDKCLSAKEDGQKWITELEIKERNLTGEEKLKITYNRIAGYYFDVPKSRSENLPFRFQKIQSMANSDRFTTSDLKQIEDTIKNAEEHKLDIEMAVFNRIRKDIIDVTPLIQQSAQQIATIDCLMSLADVAIQNDYVH